MPTTSSATDSTQLVGSTSDLFGKTSTPTNSSSPTGSSTMGKTEFLQLLVTQLQNQDPLNPMDNTTFVSQMAQFSSLEQMQNLNQTMTKASQFQELTQASGMIGKYALVIPSGQGQTPVTGQVGEVRQSGDTINVVIDGKEYDASTVVQVSNTAISDTDVQQAVADAAAAKTAAASTAADNTAGAIANATANQIANIGQQAGNSTPLPGM